MKGKILLALTLLLGASTTIWAVGNSGKANQKKHAYTNEDVWAAYEGFNNTLLDSNKYIYKTNSSYPSAVDRGNGAAAIWCQPIYWDMAMNAYKLAKAQKDRKKTSYYKTLCEKIFAGNKAQYCQFDFDDNNENTGWFIYDDIMWWTISLARGYELFGVDEYLKLSEASFKRVWYGSEKWVIQVRMTKKAEVCSGNGNPFKIRNRINSVMERWHVSTFRQLLQH